MKPSPLAPKGGLAASSLEPGQRAWLWPTAGPSTVMAGLSGARLASVLRPVILPIIAGHLLLTCFSTRYTSAGNLAGLSPSWLIAVCTLLIFPSNLLGWQREASPVSGDAAPCSIPQEHLSQDLSGKEQAATQRGGPGRGRVTKATFAFVKKLARKVLQPGRGPAPVAPPEDTAGRSSFLRRFSNTTTQDAERMSGRGGLWRRRAAFSGAGGSRWQPSMTRITSGQHLDTLQDDTTSNTSMSASRQRSVRGGLQPGGPEVPLVPHAGHLAVDCIHHDTTPGDAAEITQIVTNQHLLQFGALLGESSAELALTQAGAPPAQSPAPGSLLGGTDNQAHWGQGWETISQESCRARGIHYCAWRRYMRKGLFIYKSRTVFEGVTPQQLVAFYFDEQHKRSWDDAVSDVRTIPPASTTPPGTNTVDDDWSATVSARSAFMYARNKFPAPMAQREYVYVRRVWAKADDGGCYCLFKSAQHPAPPAAKGRTVRVQDFVSGVVIRESVLATGATPAAEMVTVYFEDSHVSPGIMNLAVRKALWPGVQKMEAALRQHVNSTTGQAMAVTTSNVLKQACMPRSALPASSQQTGSAMSTLRRCMSAAGSRRCSLDGMGGADGEVVVPQPGLHPTLSTPMLTANLELLPFHQMGANVQLATTPKAGAMGSVFAVVPAVPTQALGRVAVVPVQVVGKALWVVQSHLVMQLIALARLLLLVYARLLAALLYMAEMIRSRMVGSRPAGTPAKDSLTLQGLQSHPLTLREDSLEAAKKLPNGPKKLGRKIAARLALLAVRVSVPIAHHVLTRTNSTGGQGLNGYESVSSQMGTVGASTRAQHVGHEGRAAGTHASRKESAARVVKWLDCLSASLPADYMGGHHAEIVQQQMALYTQQQLAQQQQQGGGGGAQRAVRQRQVSASAGGALPSRLHSRSSLGSPIVPDGVIMPW